MKPIWLIEDFTGNKKTLGIHMKPKWLIENFVGDNGYEELINEVKRQGFTCHVLDITNHFDIKPGMVQIDDCAVFQGSIQLFRKLKNELAASPLGWMTDENYKCSRYYPYVQKFLFNDKHVNNNQRTYVPSAPEKATKLVKEILDIGYYPDPVFVVDICEDMDGNYWLMEMNSFTSAGTYAAKKELIVKRVSEIAEEEWKQK